MNETELKRIWGILSSKFNMSNFTYDMFKQNMSNVEGRKKFWGKYSKDLKLDDYNLYEKNLTTNQTSTQGTLISPNTTPPPKPSQTVDSSVFNCIKNSNTKGKNLQQTKDNPEAYSFFNTDGSEFTFWVNGDFTYYDGDTTANGKWKCKGGNNFEANVDWKGTTHYYRSETNEWALTQNAKKTVYENTIKKIVSKNLKSLTK
jgi:hypothetical protein